jgi:hypothetical protein
MKGPVPFFLGGDDLAKRKAANSGGLKVGSGEDPSPEYDLEEQVGCGISLIWIKPERRECVETVI